jgi:hypothetical protein
VRSLSQLVSALVLAAASGCATSVGTQTAPPVMQRVQTAIGAVASAPKTAAREERVRVLYEDDWFGGVTLLGVDVAHDRAVVRLEGQAPARLAFDVIDLGTMKRVDRWQATDDHAKDALKGPWFAPITGSFDGDAKRFAGLLRDLGPWHVRPSIPLPTFAVSTRDDAWVFGAQSTDGNNTDWLYASAQGGASRRVDGGLVSSYSPVMSPDGMTVAFRGCASSPCDYGLFLSKLDEDRPRRQSGIVGSSPPVWTARGDGVLALGTRGDGRCLFKATLGNMPPRSLTCVKGLRDVGFAQDPVGRTAAIAGVRGQAGVQSVEVTWVLVEDGTVLGTHTVDRAVGSSVLSDTGLLALPMQKGAVGVVDLVTGTSAVEQGGWFFGFEGARWRGEELVLLRKVEGKTGFQIVAVDVHSLAGRGKPWL